MKKFLFALLCALLASCASIQQSPEAQSISNLRIPGELVQGQCAKYAFCLNYVLFKRGIECRAVAYVWNVQKRAHAIVLFKLGEQWWAIDNQEDSARKVFGSTDLALVKSFDPFALSIQPEYYYHSYKVAGWLKELAAVCR